MTTAERPTERPPPNRTPIHPLTDRSPATPPGHDHIKIKEAYRLKKAGTEQQLVHSGITISGSSRGEGVNPDARRRCQRCAT